MRDFLPLVRPDYVTHMYCPALYLKDGFPYSRDVSLENSEDSF